MENNNENVLDQTAGTQQNVNNEANSDTTGDATNERPLTDDEMLTRDLKKIGVDRARMDILKDKCQAIIEKMEAGDIDVTNPTNFVELLDIEVSTAEAVLIGFGYGCGVATAMDPMLRMMSILSGK